MWQPTDNLQLSAAYIYNKTEFEDFDRANCWISTSWLTGLQDPGRGIATNEFCDRSGDPLDLNAEHTYIISATHTFNLTEDVQGFVHANYNYRTEQYRDANIDPLKKIDGYGLLNTRIGINLQSFGIEVAAWARNLLDEDYLATHTDVPLQDGKLNAYPTEPRTYGLSLTKTF